VIVHDYVALTEDVKHGNVLISLVVGGCYFVLKPAITCRCDEIQYCVSDLTYNIELK
jgi:hypothetical protein